MDPKLCQNLYIVRSTLSSDPDTQLLAFLQKLGINVTIGDKPVEYLLQVIANQSVTSNDSSDLAKPLPDASVTSDPTSSDCSDLSRINDSIGANSVCASQGKAIETMVQTTVVTKTTSTNGGNTADSVTHNNCQTVVTTIVTTTQSVSSKQSNKAIDLIEPDLVIAPSHPSARCTGNVLFVLGDFRGQVFRQLLQQTQCVIGFTALLYYFREKIVS